MSFHTSASACSVFASYAFATSVSASALIVTSAADTGVGTLRAALKVAETRGEPSEILVVVENDIRLKTGLANNGQMPIAIHGIGQTISTSANTTLFTSAAGADVTMTNLTFEGPGGFDVLNRGDQGQSAGKGIFIDVRDDQTGEVILTLDNVTVRGVAGHGIHISDCSLAHACGGGSGGTGAMIITTSNLMDGFDSDGVNVTEN